MEVVHDVCAGLDVHKKTVVVCVLRTGPKGIAQPTTRTFGTMVEDLESLAGFLAEQGVKHLAMEATGVYWKPIYNILEERPERFELVVANPNHLKAIPRLKTDVQDAVWIATLLRHGLVKPSFIPDRQLRQLRELTRYRTALTQDRAREVNRLQKTLEGANIKLASVVTDVTGKSGQRMLEALLHGTDDLEEVADLADGRIQKKREQLVKALEGRLEGPQEFVVSQQLRHIQELDQQIGECDQAVERYMLPFEDEVVRLDGIPGVGRRTAQVIVAEIGTDMTRFPTPHHLASWAGMAPRNSQSADKQRSVGTGHGSPWLRAALCEAGWAAGRCKAGYLASQYRRLAARRGRKRAIVAVAHSILVIVHQMLADGTTYNDLGTGYFDQRDRAAVERRAVKRLESLGFRVTLEPITSPEAPAPPRPLAGAA